MSIAKINEVTKANSQRICGVVASAAAGGLPGIEEVNNITVGSSFSSTYSLSLNGTTQYANLGSLTNSALQPTQSSMNSSGFTMSAWVYFTSGAPTDYVLNIGQSGTNNYYGLKVNINTSRYVTFHVFGLNGTTPGAGSNNRNSLRTSTAIPNNVWKHIAVVVPAGSMGSPMNRANWKIYINGVSQSSLVASGNQNVNLTYSGNSSLGAQTRASAQNFYEGQLNNVAVWDTALSTNNLLAVFNSGTPIDLNTNSGNYTNSSDLIAWWRFNEGSGTSYTDSSTNSFTGSGVNTPTWSTNTP